MDVILIIEKLKKILLYRNIYIWNKIKLILKNKDQKFSKNIFLKKMIKYGKYVVQLCNMQMLLKDLQNGIN